MKLKVKISIDEFDGKRFPRQSFRECQNDFQFN